jgi:hypothetical protein
MRAIDPFRAALSNAVLWSSNLQTRIDVRVSTALSDAASALGLQSTVTSTAPSVQGSRPEEALTQGVADVDAASQPASEDPAPPTSDDPTPPTSEDPAPRASEDPAPPTSDDPAPPVAVAARRVSDRSLPPREQTADVTSPLTSDNPTPPVASSGAPGRPPPSEQPTLTPGRADRILREWCPACFGLQTWGRPLQE